MKILIDKDVDHKELKRFIRDNNLESDIFGLNAEQYNSKVEQKPGLLVLGGPTKLAGRLASEEALDNFEKIKKIIGKDNLGDCLHLESAVFENYNYLITNDKDILSKRQQLKELFPNLKIENPSGFKEQMK